MGKRFAKFFFSVALGILIFTFMVSYQSFSGTTGKISGFVKDAETGDPLPGVNVVLQGTTMGAATDIDGYFFVINIPPGTYTLKATMMVYQSQSAKINVTVDLTTKVNFDLKPTVMDLGEAITVTAERPLIEPEVTSKRAVVTADMIENMPVRSVQDIMSLQSGVIVMDDGHKISGFETRGIDQVIIRGGSGGEIAYMVDGMYVEDAIYAGMGTSVNREAIQELTTIIGAFDAEYGEAQSAVVNIVTKEGGTDFNIVSEYNSSEIAGIFSEADDVRQAHQAIGSISGPVPFIKGMNFFISGEQSYGRPYHYKFDDHTYDPTPINDIIDNPNDPRYQQIVAQIDSGIITEVDNIEQLRNSESYYYVGDVLRAYHTGAWRKAWRYRADWDDDDHSELIAWDNIAGWRGLGFKKNWDVTAKLAWRISPSMKIIVPIRFNQRTQRTWFINAFGNFLFAMNGLNVLDDRTDQQTFIFTHQISPKLFYEIRGSRFFKGRTYRIHGIDGHRLTPGHDDEFSEAYQIFYNDPTIEVNFGPQEYPTYTEANDFAIPLTFIRYDTLSDGTIKHIYRGAAERYWARNFQQSI